MDVSPLVWCVSLGLAAAVLIVDVAVVGRRPHIPSTAECLRYLGVYVGLAVAFAVLVWAVWGADPAGEFVAGWLTEYSLSVDNLFVFLLIMSRFAVPRQYQQTALLVGIILALVFRGIFIGIGAAAIASFSWVFYLFGAFLVWTAVKVAREGVGDEEEAEDYRPPALVRLVQRVLPTSSEYHGVRLTAKVDGRRHVTPMLLVLVAIGATDLLFAFDSIPAVFGLTQEPYLVLMANVFALMGLRQLYFLLGGLLTRLRYLNIGLGVLLGFIGVKLVLQALHENALPFVNGGEPVPWAPELPTWVSLAVIVVTLGVTAVTSIAASRRDERREAVRAD
ncbi:MULTISPECIES: TerC/Alx family metal homeostasis membrane protein [unclassified Cellulomonas]|uniref:TerC/Alx family metal homeostasis membrane protein n=1 Tax=unclassified Cellulomonas TaxID=2620175 RepID=UPI0019BADCB3|nr:TerC/Alx family metal homeostasis membrane protein [Cellulomonas sp. ES6]MBD3779264.1 TerC/Alx family metal homeostasis membrane protein [Micrococcales bacterium]WHP17979.1 TerC/Alx family metal homeostasis membrane protein [Cellulomonas sp. ES6]